uniref:Uncharacterized protein n=1 Tax=Anguilla anguilla TaxID=7936 RepID=A0A0E9VFG3_ANGAN
MRHYKYCWCFLIELHFKRISGTFAQFYTWLITETYFRGPT